MGHIAIVEDDDILSDMLAAKLKASGHQVTLVEDGGDAVPRISGAMPDLVVLDCALPTVSGAGVLRSLRETLPDADMPVILMSARSNDEYIQSMMMEGATAFLVKPLNLRRFTDMIEQQLTLKAERAQAA